MLFKVGWALRDLGPMVMGLEGVSFVGEAGNNGSGSLDLPSDGK